LVGDADGALPIPNDIRVSRLVADSGSKQSYRPRSHGTYIFMIEGSLRTVDTLLGRRDSIGVWNVDVIECQTAADVTVGPFVEVGGDMARCES
jgi:quercetin 2,3-dioxygenase